MRSAGRDLFAPREPLRPPVAETPRVEEFCHATSSGRVTPEILARDEAFRHACEVRYIVSLAPEERVRKMTDIKKARPALGYTKLREGVVAALKVRRDELAQLHSQSSAQFVECADEA